MTEVGYVIEVENGGIRKLFGPVIGFSRANIRATMLRELDSQAIIRVHRLAPFKDDFGDMYPTRPVHPNHQTTVEEQISTNVSNIHDHVA